MTEIDGYVISIGRKYFWARLKFRTEDHDEYDVQMPIARVTKRDRNVFQPGAIFVARIRKWRATLRFSHRRWTAAELNEARSRARELIKHFAHSA